MRKISRGQKAVSGLGASCFFLHMEAPVCKNKEYLYIMTKCGLNLLGNYVKISPWGIFG